MGDTDARKRRRLDTPQPSPTKSDVVAQLIAQNDEIHMKTATAMLELYTNLHDTLTRHAQALNRMGDLQLRDTFGHTYGV